MEFSIRHLIACVCSVFIVLSCFFVSQSVFSKNASSVPLSSLVSTDHSIKGKYTIHGGLLYLSDDENLTLPDIITLPDNRFLKADEDSVNTGFSGKAIWLKLSVVNNKNIQDNLILVVDLPILKSIEFYELRGDQLISKRVSGVNNANRDNSRAHRLPNFSFLLEPGQQKQIYLRVESENGFVPLGLWEEKGFIDYSHHVQLFEGVYFGIMLLVGIYNLLLYFSIKDKAYLYYVLYIGTFIITISMLNGYALEYFPSQVSSHFIDLLFFLVLLQTCFLILFTKHFLSIKSSMPVMQFLLNAVFVILCFSMVLQAFLSTASFAYILPIVSSVACSIVLIAGAYSWHKGNFLARYFLLSWSAVLIGVFLYVLKLFDLVPENYFIQNAIQIGSAIEAVLQSLGLAAKITYLEKENDVAQQQALMLQIKTNYELEDKVRERTVALEQLAGKLAKYLSPQVYNSIFEGENDVHVQTRRKKLTIFFSDIKGFTEITDSLESEVLSNLLNNYLDEMAQIALKYGGTIDKFIGDAVMVFFGDPQTNGEKADAIACVKMAIEMREKMIDLRVKWRNEGIASPLHIRCGVNTGFCTVGNFGCENRMDYTIVGGQVNLASRLESKAMMDQILISHETYALIKDEIYCEPQDDMFVKGIHYAIRCYQVVDSYDALQAGSTEFIRDMHGFNLMINFREVERETALLQLNEAIRCLTENTGDKSAAPGLYQAMTTPVPPKTSIN